MTPYIIDTGSDEGAWADALREASAALDGYILSLDRWRLAA